MAVYKVVEINNVTALRTGQMVSQVPYKGSAAYIENGIFFKLANDGTLALGASEAHNPILHYTEELILDGAYELNKFALFGEKTGASEYTFYPRGLVLNVGDVFTTNNADALTGGIYYIHTDGTLKKGAGSAGQHIFFGVVSTLPNGDAAVEFMYVGVKLA